jgi:ISXO2-like transposase domain
LRKGLGQARYQNDKRNVVVIMRVPLVFRFEEAQSYFHDCSLAARRGNIIHADEAARWDALHSHYLTKRINHREAYWAGEARTNFAEKSRKF